MSEIKRALVVGAGIAGCSAAIVLAKRGIKVTLIEKQNEWRFQSSGIFVYSNGLQALQRVGVLDDILSAGFAINDGKNIYLDHEGKPIVDVYYPTVSPEIPPILGIKRSEIHRILAARLDHLGVNIRLATTVQQIVPPVETSAEDATEVVLSDGSMAHYDLILACDGIRSQVRQLVFPEIKPRSTHFGVWRSVHDRPADLDKKFMMMGVGKRLGIMPISAEKLYIFGTISEPENPWFDPHDWPALMRAKFSEFQGPVRQFLDEVSDKTEALYTVVEEVVAPLPWHRGHVLLMGDAAHASTPFMGQGGAMAIEDAVVLGDLLDTHGHHTDILTLFGQQRQPVCQFVQDASRRVGEAGAVEDPDSCLKRNQGMKDNAQNQVDQFYEKLVSLHQN